MSSIIKITKGSVKFFLVISYLLFSFSSCEKVIQLKLNDASKQYVIEGIVTDEPGTCQVQISQTVNFSDASQYPPVSGAVVTVTDDDNNAIKLTETSPGMYETNVINGAVGHTYTLLVTINGNVFTATSQMPQKVPFDSLYVSDFEGFGSIEKIAYAVFQDPVGKGNSYHFVEYKNGVRNNTIFIVNDDFSDGRINTSLLIDFANNSTDDDKNKIQTNDTVTVEMQCVDAAIYKYWYSLNASGTGNSNNASPGNPVTNISGGALGYFSAHTVQSRTVIAQ